MFIVGIALLLLAWPVFIPAALGTSGRARLFATLAVLAGAAGLGWELWMDVFSGASASIRLDLFAVAVVLSPLYMWAAVEVGRVGWARVGWTGGGLTVVAVVLMSAAWQGASRAGQRLDLAVAEGNRLLFEAKFRNEEAYARYFGMDGKESDFPVGHWEAVDRRSITRVVINPAGHLRAFFGEDPEGQFGEGARLEARGDGDGWDARLVHRGVGQRQLTIERPSSDTMRIDVDGLRTRFRLTPPPLLDLPDPDGLEYLGPFSAAVPYRDRVRVSQVWLWRDAEGLLAIGALDHLFPGRRHDFMTPLRWGRGVPTPEGFRFEWKREGLPARQALLRMDEAGVHLRLPGRGEHWPPHTLQPGAVIRDDVVELADRTDARAWDYWFDQLLVAHFFSASPDPDS